MEGRVFMAQKKDEKTKKWFFYGKYIDPLTGKYKNYKRRGFKTKTEAKVAESLFLENIEEIKKGNVLMSNLIKDYLEHCYKFMKDSSYISLSNRIKNHITPFFKDMHINDVTTDTIRKWKDYMTDKGLSLRYRKDIFIILSMIFNYADKYYNIDNRSCKKEGNFKEQERKKEMQFWTFEEFKKFDSVIDDLEYKAFFNFLYYTGCRRGEAQAINWNDFSKGYKTVEINKNVFNKIKGEPYKIQPPKTPESYRTISLPNFVISLLEQLYEQDSKIDGFSKNCFVFGVNKPLSDTTIERRKNKFCKLANVKQIRIHDFRHSHASYLINNMPNDQNLILAISKRLGHSSPTTTLKIYAHMMPSDEDKILNILNKNG